MKIQFQIVLLGLRRFRILILKEGVIESESIAQNRPLKSRDTY